MGGFPFSAVLGQERLKLALVLCAIDPAIGGVLVRGPRGVGKTTVARAFSELLPGRFVELPLGATEERVVGSLDLGKALGQGELAFSPGLLARAHDGVLYVDEVNLLPDALVDLLLDAAATGRNVVERDGVSHEHPARFVLIGTMNPEEGELRPQFCDRFGLSVAAENALTPDERMRITLRRLEFEREPERFMVQHEAEQRDVIERAAAARRRVRELPFAGAGVARVAELCHAAQVEGVRADLAMLRAARAHAAWREHGEILASDVDAVADLALAHRRRGPPPGVADRSPGSGGSSGSDAGSRREPSGGRGPSAGRAGGSASGRSSSSAGSSPSAHPARSGEDPTPSGATPSATKGSGRSARQDALDDRGGRGALEPVPVRSGAPPALPLWLLEPARAVPGTPTPRALARAAVVQRLAPRVPLTQRRRRGAHVVGDGPIDWFATLLHVRELEALARPPASGESPSATSEGAPSRLAASRPSVKRRPRRLAREGRWVLALDCSASMLDSGALSAAKGVARALANRAASRSIEVALVSFGGDAVSAVSVSQREGANIQRAILSLGASGGTPLRRALELALEAITRPGPLLFERRLFLLTDGRTRELLDDVAAHSASVRFTVIDCECGPLRLGRARRIAATLKADYVHIDRIHVDSRESEPATRAASNSQRT